MTGFTSRPELLLRDLMSGQILFPKEQHARQSRLLRYEVHDSPPRVTTVHELTFKSGDEPVEVIVEQVWTTANLELQTDASETGIRRSLSATLPRGYQLLVLLPDAAPLVEGRESCRWLLTPWWWRRRAFAFQETWSRKTCVSWLLDKTSRPAKLN